MKYVQMKGHNGYKECGFCIIKPYDESVPEYIIADDCYEIAMEHAMVLAEFYVGKFPEQEDYLYYLNGIDYEYKILTAESFESLCRLIKRYTKIHLLLGYTRKHRNVLVKLLKVFRLNYYLI